MLDLKGWLPQAQALDEGRSARVDHDCGPGRTLTVHHEADRWWGYCFRCNDHGYEAKPAESLAERLARRRREQDVDEALEHSVSLPTPINFDVDSWPMAARLWLYKAALGRREIKELGVYWHEPSGRVVVPVFDSQRPVYWQARSVDGRAPKYINPKVDRQHIVARFGQGEVLVLTEDTLSAYRVGQHTEAWSLMGVKLNDIIAARIVRRGGPVLVWLDPDWQYPEGKRPGVIAAKKITRQLSSMGIPVQRITSRADPKLLSRREINNVLGHYSAPAAERPRTV
ncbi:DNA primase [Ralstonia phage RS-PII-1]|uniref:DNA primase/helicase n=1 Tax=Ralstonia phage RS-PII-1 TaxID=1932892 RepID=A0A1L7DQD5_9CAUD|nr:DNA primase [Ralstonia phage RS-PII-1]APU00320.1 DNA primase/helicase [Ralstonia phage RS-PII-1]